MTMFSITSYIEFVWLREYHKVNRFLARYSPRATTTNQPTNRAPNEPEGLSIYVPQKAYFGAKMAVFGPNILIIFGRSKKINTYISEND